MRLFICFFYYIDIKAQQHIIDNMIV